MDETNAWCYVFSCGMMEKENILVNLVWLYVWFIPYDFHALRVGKTTFLINICEQVDTFCVKYGW